MKPIAAYVLAAIVTPLVFSGVAQAEQICVEEAAGVCLKYKEAPAQKPAKKAKALTPAQEEERALRLSRNELREVQVGLRSGGYYDGGIDGVIGAGSRRAISRWQSANGEQVTGYLTFDQVRRLKTAAFETPAPARQRTKPLAPTPEPTPEPTPTIAAPKPKSAPEKPEPGRTYRILADAAPPEPWLDPMLVTVKVRRRDDASAVVAFQLSGANQYSFSRDCVVQLDQEFACRFNGPNRNKNTWSMSGRLPQINVANGWVSFSKTYTLW